MSKKKIKNSSVSIEKKVIEQKQEEIKLNNEQPSSTIWYDKFLNGFIPYLLIFACSIVLYANTFSHQFALDDDIVICKNEYVIQGLHGIPSIFSKDLFDSFYKQMNADRNQLTGGRYRPLSIATFAIEQEFIGTREDATFPKSTWDTNNNGIDDPSEDINGDGLFNDKDVRTKGFQLRHIDNVLFYGLSISILFLFLSTVVFKRNKLVALVVSLLFLAHPIHTEVVANVKSRDEILSFLFIILSLYFAHQIEIKNKLKYIALTCFTFLCALLSKEYGATLIVLIPLSLYLFSASSKQFLSNKMLYVGIALTFIIYLGMRSQVGPLFAKSATQETEILNAPYLLATSSQEIATKLFVLLKYIGILLLPTSLCSDYGFNSIPYKNFSDLSVWMSIILLVVMSVVGIIGIKKRNWMAFAIAFYLLNLALISNFIFNVGATMGERLVFHSSLGFCLFLGFGINYFSEKINKPILIWVVILPILFLYSIKTIDRNKAWKNDITLALTDVEINPNSTALNGNASSRNIDLSELPANKASENEYLQKSIKYGRKAITLHPGFVNGYLNLGLAYAKIAEYDSAKVQWDKAFKLYPHHPQKNVYYNLLAETYYSKGYNLGAKQQFAEGINYLEKAVEINPTNARYWYDLGGFAYSIKDFSKSKQAWTKAYQLNPSDTNIQKVLPFIK